MGNSFKLDDLLRDDDGVKPPQKKKGAKPGDGYALDDLLGSDSTAAPAPVGPPKYAGAPAPNGPKGDVVLGSNGSAAPVPAPAPRRGIMGRIGDAITGFLTPSEQTAKAMVAGAQGMNPSAQAAKDLYDGARVDKRLLPTGDTRTAARRKADAVAVRRKYEGTIGQKADNTSVAPDAALAPVVKNQLDANLSSGREHDARVASEEAQAQANFTPEQHLDLAKRGEAYAAKLNEQAMALRASDPAGAEALHQRAEAFNKKAANHGLISSGIAQTGTTAAKWESALLGPISDPYAGQQTNLATAARGENVFTPEEQQEIGRNTPVGTHKDVPLVSEDNAIKLAGSLPYLIGGDALLAGGIKGAAALFPKVRGIAGALESAIEVAPRMGPARAGFGGLRDAASEFAADAPTLIRRGATIGQVPMAAVAAREAQQRGENPTDAALQSVVGNLALGPLGELAFGAAGKVLGVAGRTIENVGRKYLPSFDPTPKSIGAALATEGKAVIPEEIKPVAQAVDGAREVEGKTPLGDQTPEGQRATIAKALSDLLDKKLAEDPAGDLVGPSDRLVEPVPGRPRSTPVEEPRLRTAVEIATEDMQTPRDEANAFKQMERQKREADLVDANARELADQARIEQAAREKQGPLTLSQTIMRAGKDADAGDPMAADYKKAINDHVDALARVQEAGENGPSLRDKIAVARSVAKLNEFRKKYGMQTGSAALVAVAANSDDLTDHEKQMVGLAAVMGTTALVKHLPAEIHANVMSAFDTAAEHLQENHAQTPDEWMQALMRNNVDLGGHEREVRGALNQYAGGDGSLRITAPEAKKALDMYAPAGDAPISAGFTSRLRTSVERMGQVNEGGEWKGGKKWDEPRPAADWIGKLKGGGDFSKAESSLLMPLLEEAQANKVKLSRDDVLGMIEDTSPRIERQTLAMRDRSEPGAHGNGDGEDVIDIDDLEGESHDVLHQQIANREAAISSIESHIEDQQNDYEHTMRSAEDLLQSQYNDLERAIEENFPNADSNGLEEATQYLRENVEAEYIPRGVVDKAWEKLMEHGEMYGDTSPREPSDQGVKLKEREGPNGETEWVASLTNIHNAYDQVSADDWPGAKEWVGATQYEALAGVERAGFYESGSSDGLFRGAKVVESVGDDGEPEYAIMQGKHKIDFGPDREELVRSHVEDNFEGAEGDYDTIKSELETYAERLSEYNAAESEHYYASEGEMFSEEQEQIEKHKEEIGQIETMIEETPEGGNIDRQINAGEEANPVLAPIKPKIHGQPKFSSYQRIGGGTNYRELVNVVENQKGEAYARNHYGSIPNTAGHVRVEDHVLSNAPGLDDFNAPLELGAGATDDLRSEAEGARSEVKDLRTERGRAQKELDRIAREYDALPAIDREGEAAHALASQYAQANSKVLSVADKETSALARYHDILGIKSKGDPIAIMIESQSDLAQDAGKYGVKEVVSPARLKELQTKLDAMDVQIDATERESSSLRGERSVASREYTAEYNAEYDRRLADITADSPPVEPWLDAVPRTGDRVIALFNEVDPEVVAGKLATLREHSPNLADAAENIRTAHEAFMDASDRKQALDNEYRELSSEKSGGASNAVPASPFTDTKVAFGMNAARFLIDAAERGHDMIGWSDAGNRVRNAHLPIGAASLVYDQLTPSIMKSLLGAIGFKNVPIDKVFIRGNGHWRINLSAEMRTAIRKNGLPLLGVLGAMAATPDDAQAQDGSKVEAGKLYTSAVGGIAAGGLIVAMATNRKLRSLVKENRELSRELMLDDLSGLANGRAFRRARESVDRDPSQSWIAFDGDRFKKLNDVHGHAEGDKAIQHFGETIRKVSEEKGVPMRGFRQGGDEFGFAVPKERAAEVMKAIEDASRYEKDGVAVKLSGMHADTFSEADALLKDMKNERKKLDPSLRRDETDTGSGVTLYANPVGPALRELKRYPSAAGVVAVGYAMGTSDNEQVKRASLPVMALGALSAIGAKRLYAGGDYLGSKLVDELRKSPEGTKFVRAFNPDALLSPEVQTAIRDFERGSAKGKARAAEFSGKAKKLGPEGDRAVSDVLEGEGWEGPQAQTANVLAVATELSNEYDRLTQEQLTAGTLDQSQVLPDYGGPRRYAFYDAQDALADSPSGGGTPRAAKIGSTKTRTLDIPIREAEGELRTAQAANDQAAITAAQDKLDQAHAVQMSQRVERGEIRESSYRAAIGIEKAHHNVASAKLFETLRNAPGTIHPEWQTALDDLLAAKDLYRNSPTQADKDVAENLQNEAGAKISEITRRFKQRDGDYVSLPDSPAMGMLRGAVVQRDVAHSLEGFDAPRVYGKMLRAWKEIKTVFNVGTHIGNMLSNVTALHMGEVPVWLQPYYYTAALKDLKAYGEGTRALAEAGIMNVNSINALGEGAVGSGMRSQQGLEELLPTTRPETQKVLRENGITEEGIAKRELKSKLKGAAIGGTLGAAKTYDPDHPENAIGGAVAGAAAGAVFRAKRADKIRSLYGHEDNIARLAVFLRRRKLGDSIEQATQMAVSSLGDFRSRSPALRVISSTVSPFVMYQAKAVPAFARQIVDHPWKYLSLIGAWGAMNELGKAEMGEVPETDKPLNQRQDLGYFFPGFTQLPFGNEKGEKAAVDMARWTPLSGLTTGAPPGSLPEAFGDNSMQLVTPGGPVIDAALQGSNVDPYTKGPLLKRDRPTRENVGALLNKAADFVLPSSIGFHSSRLKEDMDNEDWTKFKNDLFGPLGVKPKYVRPGAVAVDAEYTLERSLREMKQELKQRLRANKNEDRVPELTARYKRDVAQALLNFKERIGTPPTPALVNEFLSPSEP